MTVFYVASSAPRAGKTALCAALAAHFARQGKPAVVLKPLSVEGSLPDPDAEAYRSLLRLDVPEPRTVSARALLSTVGSSSFQEALRVMVQRAPEGELVLVEGLSGLAGEQGRASAVLAEFLSARVLLVVPYHEALSSAELEPALALFGPRMTGVLVNNVTRYKRQEVQEHLVPVLEGKGMRALGVVPEDRRLLGVTVGELAASLGGRFVTWPERADNLVEHFMIGGWFLDNGVPYFNQRANKAVIIRGNRPDLQMAALETPTACILCTEGHSPVQYVEHQAWEVGVPLIVVSTTTLQTAELLGGLLVHATFNHPLKLERYTGLLEGAVDLQVFSHAVGAGGAGSS